MVKSKEYANILVCNSNKKREMEVPINSHLKDIMESKGVTMSKLASASGTSIETIRRARGEKIGMCRLETLAVIAKVLKVKIADLFDEK